MEFSGWCLCHPLKQFVSATPGVPSSIFGAAFYTLTDWGVCV